MAVAVSEGCPGIQIVEDRADIGGIVDGRCETDGKRGDGGQLTHHDSRETD